MLKWRWINNLILQGPQAPMDSNVYDHLSFKATNTFKYKEIDTFEGSDQFAITNFNSDLYFFRMNTMSMTL